jgi:hypothetical protein
VWYCGACMAIKAPVDQYMMINVRLLFVSVLSVLSVLLSYCCLRNLKWRISGILFAFRQGLPP